MSLVSIRDSIVSSLEGISGLTVHNHMPDSWSEFPAVGIRLWSANYTDLTFTFRLLLLTDGWDEATAETALHPFLDRSGGSSIDAALSSISGCLVVSTGRVDRKTVAGVPYMGAELTVIANDT